MHVKKVSGAVKKTKKKTTPGKVTEPDHPVLGFTGAIITVWTLAFVLLMPPRLHPSTVPSGFGGFWSNLENQATFPFYRILWETSTKQLYSLNWCCMFSMPQFAQSTYPNTHICLQQLYPGNTEQTWTSLLFSSLHLYICLSSVAESNA